jgi:hypothetical protein
MTTLSRPVRLSRWLRDEIRFHVETSASDAAVFGDEAHALLCESTLAYLTAGPMLLAPAVAKLLQREALNIADIAEDKRQAKRAAEARAFAAAVGSV